VESAGATSGLTTGTIDLKGVVLANVLTPVAGGGTITNEQITAYFSGTGRSNQVILSTALPSLLLNNFNATSPGFLPQSGSPLLTGAVMDGKNTNTFFTPVTFRGAFGTDNWTTGWTNFNPQTVDYDR